MKRHQDLRQQFTLIAMLVGISSMLLGQSTVWIDPNRGDPNKRRSVIMNGNDVESMVGNWGNVGQGSNPISGVWPKGTGHDHIHEFTGIVGAEVPGTDGGMHIIVSDGFTDGGSDEIGNDGIEFKFHPLTGYFNEIEGQDEFANSLNPESWPATWPGKDMTWDGLWNGFFGLHQFNADQEAMYYIDDTWNREFPFYPYDDEPEWQGLGVQVHVRLFQWAHPLAKDILFFYYEITNAGDFDYDVDEGRPITFGGYGDIGPGGRGTVDDDAAFDDQVDMVYGWDHDNIGVWTQNRDIPPGYLGWKFLESPGIDNDFIDNDNDGLTDERRDNDAGAVIFGPVGIYGEEKEHFEGDEDGDWLVEVDDVGADGIDELDEGYPGPDADGTEGNGIPDQGEPNFGRLDNDESDQIGLTAFSAPLFGTVLAGDEEALWPRLQPGFFEEPTQTVNQYWIFASGPVNLLADHTERFSTCYLFAFTEQALFQTAGVGQRIYDSDYRFARPPRQPVLRAIPGDERVTLVWDGLAELSRDPIYGFDFEGYRIYRATDPQFLDVEMITDSRGNPLFRVPIAQFDLDNGLLGPHPLQFGEEIDAPTGIHFHMGDDTGLSHFYIDDNLINGRTYYYAITAYDRGHDDDFFERGLANTENLLPITPSESPASIVVTEGLITRFDPNTVEVIPNAQPTNVAEATSNGLDSLTISEGFTTGNGKVIIVDQQSIVDGDYAITFETVPGVKDGERETGFYSIFEKNSQRTIIDREEVPWSFADDNYSREWIGEALDEGFMVEFTNEFPDTGYLRANSGWSAESNSNWEFDLNTFTGSSAKFPINLVIEWGPDSVVQDTGFRSVTGTSFHYVNFKVYEEHTQEPQSFLFVNLQSSGDDVERIDMGEQIIFAFKEDTTETRYSTGWRIRFEEPRDEEGNELPEAEWITPSEGDKLIIRNRINFSDRDVLSFQTTPRVVAEGANDASVLDKIKVVPNPYVVSSRLEKQPAFGGRGERFLRFINLPSECTIRIFTVNGDLIRTLEHSDINNNALAWDLKTKDNLEVAFGLYVFHVDAPGIGETIGKFAIIN